MPGIRLLFILIMIIVWIALITWVATDASKKDLSPVFWTLATVIGGPIGLVGYGIVRELKVSR